MIGKVTRGKNVGGLLRYLFGPGRTNEHTDPHLVASWLGDDPAALAGLEPTFDGTRPDVADLAARLALPMQLRPEAVDKPVWQSSMRVTEGDRRLSDAEWASVARDVVERTGFAPAGDAGGCRWVAVRHADDHIHIAVVLARQDGGRVGVFRDWPKVHAAAREAERRLGLQAVVSPDRTATVAPTRAEAEKAARSAALESVAGSPMPARAWLTRQLRAAVAGSVSREEFEESLAQVGVLVHWRESQRTPGEITGYAVGRPGDVDASGAQVWFGGSKLSPDLSLPRLRARWSEVHGPGGTQVPRPRPPLEPKQRDRILRRAEHSLRTAAVRPVGRADSVAASEVAAVLARMVEGPTGGPLTEHAERLSRASRLPRGRRPAVQLRTHSLRTTAAQLSLLGHLMPGELKHLALLLAHVVAIADASGRSGAAGRTTSPHSPRAIQDLDRTGTRRAAAAARTRPTPEDVAARRPSVDQRLTKRSGERIRRRR